MRKTNPAHLRERKCAPNVQSPGPGSVFGIRMTIKRAGRVISAIGRRAGVVVNKQIDKFASAHDLRRAFGERWALRVMPVVLKDLMRHDSLDTTLKYYVGRDAETTADVLYKAVEQSQVTFQVTSGDLIPAPS